MLTKKPRVPGEGDTEQSAPEITPPKRSDTPPAEQPLEADTEWRDRTWQEAMAAGVKRSVLCKNGWYVPTEAGFTRPAARHPLER